MTTYGGVDLVDTCWGFDSAALGVTTDEQLVKVFTTPLPVSITGAQPAGAAPQFFKFCEGYVPLPGNSSKWDMVGAKLRSIADMQNGAGEYVLVGLVQHCRSGSNVLTEAQGDADGAHAAEYATAQGYTDDCHLAVDDESIKNPGPQAIASLTAWCNRWKTPLTYEGFSPGDNGLGLPNCTAYWGAWGNWAKEAVGTRCKQHPQITFCGVGIDPDQAFPDKTGGVLRLFGRLPDPDATIAP